jgi:uncharacterized protein (TIGR03067 family)
MRLVVILLSLGIAAGASARGLADGPAPPSDQDRLQGLWSYALLPGAEPLPDPGNLPVLRISGNQVQFIEPGTKSQDAPQVLSFTLDPRQDPKTVDLQWLEDNKKVVWKGIYVLKDDEVRVAFACQRRDKTWERATERPASFDNGKQPKDTLVLVLVLRRAEAPPLALDKLAKLLPAWSPAFNGFGAVVLSPDGKWVAASGAPGTTVRVWETATAKEIAVLGGHPSEVRTVVFSRDGKRLFTADTAEVRTWELPEGKPLQRILAGPDSGTGQMTLSGDDKWFVSAPDMEQKIGPGGELVLATIRLWDVETGKEGRRFEIVRTTAQLVGQYVDFFVRGKGSDEIVGTALSQDGKWVVAGTQRGEVHLWDAATGKKVRTFRRSNDFVSVPLGFSKAGKWLATSVYTRADVRHILADPRKDDPPPTVLLWEVATGKAKHAIQGKVFGRGLSEDGQWLITGCDEKAVRIWDVETGEEVRAFAGHQKPVTDCSLSRDKKLLATYDRSGTARLWDAATGKELRALEVQPQPDQVLFSQDAKTLVTWSRSRLTLWDLERGKEIRSMRR